jgi:hypothetical protein
MKLRLSKLFCKKTKGETALSRSPQRHVAGDGGHTVASPEVLSLDVFEEKDESDLKAVNTKHKVEPVSTQEEIFMHLELPILESSEPEGVVHASSMSAHDLVLKENSEDLPSSADSDNPKLGRTKQPSPGVASTIAPSGKVTSRDVGNVDNTLDESMAISKETSTANDCITSRGKGSICASITNLFYRLFKRNKKSARTTTTISAEDDANLDGMVRYMSHKSRVERGFEVMIGDFDAFNRANGGIGFGEGSYHISPVTSSIQVDECSVEGNSKSTLDADSSFTSNKPSNAADITAQASGGDFSEGGPEGRDDEGVNQVNPQPALTSTTPTATTPTASRFASSRTKNHGASSHGLTLGKVGSACPGGY